jgi:hypothetical protein
MRRASSGSTKLFGVAGGGATRKACQSRAIPIRYWRCNEAIAHASRLAGGHWRCRSPRHWLKGPAERSGPAQRENMVRKSSRPEAQGDDVPTSSGPPGSAGGRGQLSSPRSCKSSASNTPAAIGPTKAGQGCDRDFLRAQAKRPRARQATRAAGARRLRCEGRVAATRPDRRPRPGEQFSRAREAVRVAPGSHRANERSPSHLPPPAPIRTPGGGRQPPRLARPGESPRLPE